MRLPMKNQNEVKNSPFFSKIKGFEKLYYGFMMSPEIPAFVLPFVVPKTFLFLTIQKWKGFLLQILLDFVFQDLYLFHWPLFGTISRFLC